MASPDQMHMHVKQQMFLLSLLQHIVNIDTRKIFYNAHIKLHIDYASVVYDGCGEVHLKKLNSLHRRAGKLILPDPSLSTEQKMSALGIFNLPQQLTYNKGLFMHKVLNNNSPNYLAQFFISHQFHCTNSRNKLYVPRPRLDIFKTSTSFAGASLWNYLLQNIKSCISLPCFKRNLHKKNRIEFFSWAYISTRLKILRQGVPEKDMLVLNKSSLGLGT